MTAESHAPQASESITHGRFSPGFNAGAIPGSAVYTGPARDFEAFVRVFDWTPDEVRELTRIAKKSAASQKQS